MIINGYKNIHTLYSEDESHAANCEDRPKERRPALGRKRAKFTLKPIPSSSLPTIDFSSRIDHIDDPEEYFSVFEQLENAEKELKKLRGEVSTDIVQTGQLTTGRKRRPGLRGKTASYKHHASADVDTLETFVASHEEHLNRNISTLSDTTTDTKLHNLINSEPGISPAKNANNGLQDATESEGSVVEKEKKVSNLLDKLLSSFEDFDGDEGKTFLRESLQMKSIDTGKLHLPELGNAQLSQQSASKTRVALGELKGSQISPSRTKSPLGVISALQRRVSLKDPLKDLYSVFRCDDTPCSRGSSPRKSTGKVSLSPQNVGNQDRTDFLFDGASSVAESGTKLHFEDDNGEADAAEDISIGNNIMAEEKLTEDAYLSLESNTNPDDTIVHNNEGNLLVRFHGGLQEGDDVRMDVGATDQADALVEDLDRSCCNPPSTQDDFEGPSQLPEGNRNCDSSSGDKSKDVSSCFDGGLQPVAGNMQQALIPNQTVEALTSSCLNQTTIETLASPPCRNMDGSCTTSEINLKNDFSRLDDMSQSKVDGKVQENVSDIRASKDGSRPSNGTILTDRHSRNMHSLPQENNEEHQTASRTRSKEGKKQKAPPRTGSKKKRTSRRQSLEDLSLSAGTVWEDGRRKSSRRKFRPLEHWRGERLLYGRIHKYVGSVIGVKYVSPRKDTVQVESYVPEEHAKRFAGALAQVAR